MNDKPSEKSMHELVEQEGLHYGNCDQFEAFECNCAANEDYQILRTANAELTAKLREYSGWSPHQFLGLLAEHNALKKTYRETVSGLQEELREKDRSLTACQQELKDLHITFEAVRKEGDLSWKELCACREELEKEKAK